LCSEKHTLFIGMTEIFIRIFYTFYLILLDFNVKVILKTLM